MADRRAQFVTTYLPYAQEASRLTGIDPAVILAQAAHETAWGRKAPGNNFFGIKGRGQTFATHEYVGGKRVNTKAGFRSYADPRESFLDWARLMHKPRYAGVLAATTPEDQIKELKAAGYATDPLYVRKLNNVRQQVSDLGGAIQVLPEAIAGLQDAVGGTQTPDLPAGTEAYAPALLAALDATPAQAAIDDAFGQPGDLTADQIDELTRTDAAGNYTNPLVAPPPGRPPGPGGALGVDLGQMPAGMPPPPSRPGTFDWLGGGAPEAAMVPPPGISPLRPAFGGPGDRRPQPPTPPSRPMGMPPSGPQSPVDAISPPAGPSDLVPFLPPSRDTVAPAIAPPLERAGRRIAAGGQGGPVIPITPDEMRSSLANAGANTEMSLGLGGGNLGTPETAMSLERSFLPPRPSFDQLQSESDSRLLASDIARTRGMMERSMAPLPGFDDGGAASRGLASELGFNRRQMEGYTAPPPSPFAEARTKDDPYALPGPVAGFDRAARAGQILGLPPSLNVGAFPEPSISGGGGSDALAAGNASPLSPMPPALMPPALMPSGDPWAKAYGQRPDMATQLGIHNIATAAPEASPASWATGMDQYRPMLPLPPIPGTRFLPSDADPNNITLPTEPTDIRPAAQVDAEQAPTIDPVVADANMPVVPQPAPRQKVAAAATATPSKTAEEQKKRNSFLSRLLPGGGNGFLGNFLGSFGTPPTFAAYGPTSPGWNNGRMNTDMGSFRTSGTAPYGNQGGTTAWRSGTSNAMGGTNALTWTDSRGQPVTVHENPWSPGTYMSSF